MTKLRFIPIFEDEKYLNACKEYEEIWTNDGSRIITALKEVTGRDFEESRVAAVVYSDKSFSGRNKYDAMKLRARYDYDVKQATLVHELGHRLMFDIHNESSEEEHKFLYLFLFDVWEQLYGLDFAKRMTEVESSRTEMYKSAWEFALSMSKEQRQELLRDKLSSVQADSDT